MTTIAYEFIETGTLLHFAVDETDIQPNDPARASMTTIAYEFIETGTLLHFAGDETDIQPNDEDVSVRIRGRFVNPPDDDDGPNEDAAWGALPFLFVVGVLSFADARPRGVSDREHIDDDQFQVDDLLRHFRYERGCLRLDVDYLRGRCVKTTVDVHADGGFEVVTRNRGEAATRWIARLQGKKPVRLVNG